MVFKIILVKNCLRAGNGDPDEELIEGFSKNHLQYSSREPMDKGVCSFPSLYYTACHSHVEIDL